MNGNRYEIDHVFVCASAGAPEMEHLLETGLIEGPPNHHPGQGTANRRVFFRRSMLELVWVADEAEARAPGVAPLGLWERWRRRSVDACPFGICFRAADDEPPFETWQYRPAYAPTSIEVATSSERWTEPLLFYFTVAREARPAAHPNGLDNIVAVRIEHPASLTPSPQMDAAAATGLVTFAPGGSYTMRLLFEGGGGKSWDLRPELPLVLQAR